MSKTMDENVTISSFFLLYAYKKMFKMMSMDQVCAGATRRILSHVYLMPQLKQRCIVGLAQLMNTENVVDMLHLKRLCNALYLFIKLANLITTISKHFDKHRGRNYFTNMVIGSSSTLQIS
jgi:hypothetical protein